MNILLTGASGFIGQHLYIRLRQEGHRVVAAIREAEQFKMVFADAETIAVDYSRDHSANAWLPRLSGIDIVINAVGIIQQTAFQRFSDLHQKAPSALFDACELAGVRRVMQISALGAEAGATSQYHQSKFAADQHLAAKALDWAILRPSIVYGPGAKSTGFFRALAALPVTPLVNAGEQLIQPVHIDDLVTAVIVCIEEELAVKAEIDLVGPEPLSFKAYLQCQRQWLGLGDLRPLSIPYRLARPLVKMGGLLKIGPVNSESLDMLIQGNTAPVAPLVEHLGFIPRSVENELKRTPSQVADRWYAGLYFMPGVLRGCIALLWIMTGLCSLLLYPEVKSLDILSQAGIEGVPATLSLYMGGAIDLLLGLAMFSNRWMKPALIGQLLLTVTYTLIISCLLPELWLHPFGPVTKNLPLITATLCLLVIWRKT
ncbi:SDR family oxidoreductase [uncultured Amphritea sp.]|uniref:SDR family oxidoreductase n=1 Tax=uncultured Amphritea sp. TaxID=981605 RepID=UPI002631D11E|nr:SDR family oxidoreductase [uncultured Amphritea sp.]